jgi:DnaK suppressor protein
VAKVIRKTAKPSPKAPSGKSNGKQSRKLSKPASAKPQSKPVKAIEKSKTKPVATVKANAKPVNHAPRLAIKTEAKPLRGKASISNGPKPGSATIVKGPPGLSITTQAPAYVPPAPRAPVPTDGKPRKNLAGLTPKELEHFRQLLLDKRRELVGDMSSMEREALRSTTGSNLSNLPVHMADMGTDNYEQEFTLGLVEKERHLVRDINRALAKIQDGSYGICEGTGKPIGKPRLEVQPWAKHSIEYARQMERNLMMRR